MKILSSIGFDPARCRAELDEFGRLLETNPSLGERKHILPFVKRNHHLSALVGGYNPRINQFARVAFEYSLFGDFTCDLVIGDSTRNEFCFVEFEDAKPNSVFGRKGKRSKPEWSPRFDHGFSQIVDWFCTLEDQKRTRKYEDMFGAHEISYVGLLVIGRRADLAEPERRRLNLRSEYVHVGTHRVDCITYDELYDHLRLKLTSLGHGAPASLP